MGNLLSFVFNPSIPIFNVTSPYHLSPPPFCYPGSLVPFSFTPMFPLIYEQINMIGTHTHEIIGEGGFETAQKIERDAIYWIGTHVCKNQPSSNIPKIIDGYFSSGATESNIMGLWLARNRFRTKFNSDTSIIIAPSAHYSFIKACNILDLHDVYVTNITDKFEMDISSLEKIIKQLISEHKRNIVVVATAGTSAYGSIDPIDKINLLLDNYIASDNINAHIHVDAAFGGFTIPFLEVNPSINIETPPPFIGFENSHVMTIAIDGHKMGDLPYPAGIFLCRKKLQKYTATKVHYIRGHCDDTLIGSRTAMSAFYAWHRFNNNGETYYKNNAIECITHRNKLALLLHNISHVTVHPYSPYVNILPIEVDISNGKIPDDILEGSILKNYNLRSDEIEINGKIHTIYKLCIMKHTFNFINQFVHDIQHVINTYH